MLESSSGAAEIHFRKSAFELSEKLHVDRDRAESFQRRKSNLSQNKVVADWTAWEKKIA